MNMEEIQCQYSLVPTIKKSPVERALPWAPVEVYEVQVTDDLVLSQVKDDSGFSYKVLVDQSPFFF